MSTKDYEIRPLTADRAEQWLPLRLALWPHYTAEELLAQIRALGSEYVAFAAFAGEVAIGLVEVALRPESPGCTTSPVGFLEGWYVLPEHRRRGVGRRLAEQAETWARTQGCTEMGSDTNANYPLSPAAHAALGYQPASEPWYFQKSLVESEIKKGGP